MNDAAATRSIEPTLHALEEAWARGDGRAGRKNARRT